MPLPKIRVQKALRPEERAALIKAVARETRKTLLKWAPRARLLIQADGEAVARTRTKARAMDHVGVWGPGTGYLYWYGTRSRRAQYRTAVGAGYLREIGGDFSAGRWADGVILFDLGRTAPARLTWFMKGGQKPPATPSKRDQITM